MTQVLTEDAPFMPNPIFFQTKSNLLSLETPNRDIIRSLEGEEGMVKYQWNGRFKLEDTDGYQGSPVDDAVLDREEHSRPQNFRHLLRLSSIDNKGRVGQ